MKGICFIEPLFNAVIVGSKTQTRRKQAYAALINKIHGKGTWESNPYVWVYDFKLVSNDKNE